jgi:transcriptional regulator of acetoin/glycerol metabolism
MLALKEVRIEDGITGNVLFDEDGHVRPLDDIERTVLIVALRKYRGNASDISRALQIGRTTLYRRLAYHGLVLDRYRHGSDGQSG